jgi:hypothetical protein
MPAKSLGENLPEFIFPTPVTDHGSSSKYVGFIMPYIRSLGKEFIGMEKIGTKP